MKLGGEKDKKGEPEIEQGREYTVFGLDLDEREEQASCHASVLVMTERRFEKQRCKPGDLYHFCKWQQKPCVFRCHSQKL